MKTLAQIHGLVRSRSTPCPHCVIEGHRLAADRKAVDEKSPDRQAIKAQRGRALGLIVFAFCTAERSHTIASVLS